MSKYDASASAKILAPEGMHNARIVRFLELGTQSTDWGDKFQCMISAELVDESAVFNEENGEQNFVVHRRFNRSLKPRSDMGKVVRAVLGDELDEEIEMDDILDGACQVKIKHSKDGKYANWISTEQPPKGKVAKSESDVCSLYLDENFDQDVFDELPDWLQDIIKESDEYKQCVEDGYAAEDEEDDKKKKKSKRSKDDDDDEDDEKPRGKRSRSKDDDDDEDEEDEKPRGKGARNSRPAKRGNKQVARKKARR